MLSILFSAYLALRAMGNVARIPMLTNAMDIYILNKC